MLSESRMFSPVCVTLTSWLTVISSFTYMLEPLTLISVAAGIKKEAHVMILPSVLNQSVSTVMDLFWVNMWLDMVHPTPSNSTDPEKMLFAESHKSPSSNSKTTAPSPSKKTCSSSTKSPSTWSLWAISNVND